MPLSAEDRFAIQDVVLRYAHFHDSKQTHRVAAEIFTPDAVIDFGTGTLVGRDAIAGFFDGFKDAYDTSHVVTNLLVEGEGEWARCQSHCLAWHWRKRPDIDGRPSLHTPDFTVVGGYQDELRRGPDGWRITKRRTLQYGTGVGVGEVDEMVRPILEGSMGRLAQWP